MGDKHSDGMPKPVYYQPADLTSDELERYRQFNPPLDENQLTTIEAWCSKHIFNYVVVDEDYIFFTLNSDYNKFIIFWDI